MYQLTDNPDVIICVEDGCSIPRGHRFWDAYEAWLAEGNTPEPAINTSPELADRAKAAISALLDTTVQARGYDNIVSCVSYIGSGDTTFKAEAQAASDWRDAVYRKGYELLAAPPEGVATVEQVIALLPLPAEFGWPA